MKSIIAIETGLKLGKSSFERIAEIQTQCIKSAESDVVIDIRKAKFINPAFLTVIGSLVEIRVPNKKNVLIRIDGNNKNNIKNLKDTGIFDYYMKTNHFKRKCFQFRAFNDIDKISDYSEELVNCIPIKCAPNAREYLESAIVEVFNNAFEHGHTYKNVYAVGDFDASRKHFIFSIYDDGVGIPYNVHEHIRVRVPKLTVSDIMAVQLALMDAFSTSTNNEVPRGSGLSFLEKLATKNNGSIYIHTGNVLCTIKSSGERIFDKMKNPLKGTLFVMNITVDKNHKYEVVYN